MNKNNRSNKKKVPEDNSKGKKGKRNTSSSPSSSSSSSPGDGGGDGNSNAGTPSSNNGQERTQTQQYDRQEVLDYVEQLEADAEAEAIATEIEAVVVDKEPGGMTTATATAPKKKHMEKMKKKKTNDDTIKNKTKTKKNSSSSSSTSTSTKSSPASEEDGIKAKSDQPTTKSKTSKTKKGKGKGKKNGKNNNSLKEGGVQDDDGTDNVEKTRLRRSRDDDGANFETPGAFSVDNGIVSDDDDDDDDDVDVERDDLENQHLSPAPPHPLTVSTVSQDYTFASSEPIVATLVVESDHDDEGNGNGGGDDDEETGNSHFVKPPIVTASAEPLQEMTQSTQPSFWKSKTFKVLVLIVVLLVIAIIVVVSLLSNNQQSQIQASTSNGDDDDDDADDEEDRGDEPVINKRCPPAPTKPGMDLCNSPYNPVQLLPDDDKGYTTSSFNMRDWSMMTIIAEFQSDARSDFTVTDIEVWTGGPNGVGGDNYPPISRVEGYPSYNRENFVVRQDETFVVAIEVDLSETPCTHDRLFLKGESAELGRLGQNRMTLLESSVECFDEE